MFTISTNKNQIRFHALYYPCLPQPCFWCFDRFSRSKTPSQQVLFAVWYFLQPLAHGLKCTANVTLLLQCNQTFSYSILTMHSRVGSSASSPSRSKSSDNFRTVCGGMCSAHSSHRNIFLVQHSYKAQSSGSNASSPSQPNPRTVFLQCVAKRI